MKENFRETTRLTQKKGITLIALVITTIYLTYLINAEVMREQGNATRKEVLEIPEDVLKEAIINRYMPSTIL